MFCINLFLSDFQSNYHISSSFDYQSLGTCNNHKTGEVFFYHIWIIPNFRNMTDIKTGEAKLTIPNFSGFATIPHANDALSRAICVQNLPWRFLVRMENNNTRVTAYLECLRTTGLYLFVFLIKNKKQLNGNAKRLLSSSLNRRT